MIDERKRGNFTLNGIAPLLLIAVLLLLAGCVTVETSTATGAASAGREAGRNVDADTEAVGVPSSGEAVSGAGAGAGAFNIEIDLPKTYQQVTAGEELWFTTKVLNLDNLERVDVTITYHILDASRQLVLSKSETVAVETQASFVASLQMPQNLQPGLHFLEVVLTSSAGESRAETTFEVTAEETEPRITIKFSLFDIQVDIPERYRTVHPGEELLTSIRLINVGSGGRIDVFLDYWITDEEGTVLLEERETVAVETQNNFVRTFDIPDDAAAGRYSFHAKVSYPGVELYPEYATTFAIAEKKVDPLLIGVVAGGVLLLVLVVLVLKFNVFKTVIENRQVKQQVMSMVRGK